MKSIPILVFLCGALLLTSASADERPQLVDAIMATGPLTCTGEAEALWFKNTVEDLALLMTEGVGSSLKLNEQWKPGNPDFDRARVLMAKQVTADLAGPRPFFRRNGIADGVRASLAAMPIGELQFAAAFFQRPAGRVYWTRDIDFLACDMYGKMLASFDRAAARNAGLSKRRATLKAGFEASLARRKPAEVHDYESGAARLMPLIVVKGWPELDKVAFDEHFERVRQLRPVMEKIAAPYRQKPGK
jgi:hypothetical protein